MYGQKRRGGRQKTLLALCSWPCLGLAQVVGPFPEAATLQFPVTTTWDCTPGNLVNCGQPVGRYYSVIDPATELHAFCGRHLAEDISVPAGTRVVAIGDGVVRYSRYRKALGRVVNIEHMLPDRTFFTSVYMHLARRSEMSSIDAGDLPQEGELIRKGEFVGVVSGNPADNFGAQHLHLGIRYEDTSGYRGAEAIDGRTGTKYYVGYSTHFLPNGLRRCDANPPTSIAEDEVNPDHNVIVGEWKQPPESLSPRQFIAARLAPLPLPGLATFEVRGTVSQIPDPAALAAASAAFEFAPGFVQIGDPYVFRYTVNTEAARQYR